jgi:cytoskeletal protein CcmA (bactofilin family)
VGETHADHIIINGSVKGPIYATVMLELQPKARIEGDVHYAALEMHQGAMVAGQLRPIVAGEEKPTLKLAANNA